MEGQPEARPQPLAGHSGGTGKAAAGNGGEPQEFAGSRSRRPRMDIQDAERDYRRREAGENQALEELTARLEELETRVTELESN